MLERPNAGRRRIGCRPSSQRSPDLRGIIRALVADNMAPNLDSSFPDVSSRVLNNPSMDRETAAKILYGGARLYGFGADDFAKADAAGKRRGNQTAALA